MKRAPRPDDFEWTGEYTDLDWREYWCPSDEVWADCPGPCPDGREHGPMRIRNVQAKVMRLKDGL